MVQYNLNRIADSVTRAIPGLNIIEITVDRRETELGEFNCCVISFAVKKTIWIGRYSRSLDRHGTIRIDIETHELSDHELIETIVASIRELIKDWWEQAILK